MKRMLAQRVPQRSRVAQRFLTILSLGTVVVMAAAPQAPAQTVKIGGFVKSSYYLDSRQTVSVREGDFMLYPAAENLDGDGNDLNDTSNMLFFPFFSRLTFSIGELPDAFGATVTGVVETDFFGAGNPTLNSLRMRRGLVKLDWSTREMVFGMDWSPTFIETWPRTVATEAGAPFQPFARYPQIRYTLKPTNWRFSGVVAQQRDAFAEIGGTKAQQQAGIPTVMGFAEFVRPSFMVGGGAWTKWVRPTLASDRFTATAFQGFLRWTPENFAVRAKVTYGEDLADQLMTGGYVTEADGESTPLITLAYWFDAETTGRAWGVGVFAGYLTNEGAGQDIDTTDLVVAARNPELESTWRVAPRLIYNVGKVRLAWELQFASATYASDFDSEYKPVAAADDDAVTNVRGDFSVFLFF